MFRDYDPYSGTPARIYRSVTEIREDMGEIRERIREANACLDLRALLIGFLDSTREENRDPEKWLPELEDAVSAAREAYDSLSELREELSDLREELCEVRCAMGV